MAVLRRQWRVSLLVLAIAAGIFLLWDRKIEGHTPGDEIISVPTTFATLDNGIHDADPTVGVVKIDGNLTITGGGSITCDSAVGDACNIKLVVTGNLVMQAGAKISASSTAGSGKGGNIDITVGNFAASPPTGDFIMLPGSSILANSSHSSAGSITINVAHSADVDGLVQSKSGLSGVGATQPPGGGPITIKAGCTLEVSDAGIVSSEGADPGADLVHLQACVVTIDGIVRSFGPGHAIPNSPVNHCDNANRPDKPSNSTGCVEIWAGDSLTIDRTGSHKGEVNADVGLGGQVGGRGWIDLFALGPITVLGDPSGIFAVHSNQGGTNGIGGIIHAASIAASITANGLAFQADDTGGGSSGGSIKLEGQVNVTLDDAQIFARGDFNQTGGFGNGGHVTVQAFTGQLKWTNTAASPVSIGDVRPTGADTIPPLDVTAPPAPKRGTIDLFSCLAAPNVGSGATATSFPFNGDTQTTPSFTTVCNPGPPALESYVALPPADCGASCIPQTPTPTPTHFQELTPTPGGFCNKSTVLAVLAGRIPDKVVRPDLGDSIQDAVNNASDTNNDGFIIVLVVNNAFGNLGGHVNQRVTVSQVYDKPFLLFGCSVTLHDPDKADGLPTGLITAGAGSPGNIFVMDLHGDDSEVAGWKVEGSGRTLRNVATSGNATGVWLAGDNNTMHNGNGNSNTGVGILVSGNGNTVDSADAFANGSHGVQVTGNSNKILKVDTGEIGKGNGGDGVNVSGSPTTLSEITSRSNSGNGFKVTSSGNNLVKNDAGGTPSQNNTGCEYDVAAGNTNSGQNKANGVVVAGNPFPTGCIE